MTQPPTRARTFLDRVVPCCAAAAATLACLAALAGGSSSAFAAGRGSAADFAVRLRSPRRVAAGLPFRLRVELVATGIRRPVSVSYDLELPSLVHVASRPVRVVGGAQRSTCLRSCTVGWDASRTSSIAVDYALVLPGPGEFVVGAHIVSTTAVDADRSDDTAAVTVVAVSAPLALGAPRLLTAPPRPGHAFEIGVPVHRAGRAVTPTSVECHARLGARALAGRGVALRGAAQCVWRLPASPSGIAARLQVRVRVRVHGSEAAGSWSFAVAR